MCYLCVTERRLALRHLKRPAWFNVFNSEAQQCLKRGHQSWSSRVSCHLPSSTGVKSHWTAVTVLPQQVGHEGDVDDGQAERVDARQPLLVGEGGDFPPQLIKRFVQAEHPLPFPHVCRLSLDHGDDPPPSGFAGMSVQHAAVAPLATHHQMRGAHAAGRVRAPATVARPHLGVPPGSLIIHLPIWSHRAQVRGGIYDGGISKVALHLGSL